MQRPGEVAARGPTCLDQRDRQREEDPPWERWSLVLQTVQRYGSSGMREGYNICFKMITLVGCGDAYL